LILGLLTTARYRAMKFLYSGYHLIDNSSFLFLIVMSFYNWSITWSMSSREKGVFTAIGVEAFYDIMVYTHRYWILQRLSFCIGLLLYSIYFTLLTSMHLYPDNNPEGFEPKIALIALGVRFGAFLFEKLVDVAIDIQLHNDLIKLNRLVNTVTTNYGVSQYLSYLDLENFI